MNRREFMAGVGVGVGVGGWFVAGCAEGGGLSATGKKKPNILVIMTDQQSATMLSCTGNKWVKTAAMDSVMKKGMRFEKAYAANPVCMPSRFSILTGYYPSAIDVRANGGQRDTERYGKEAMGWVFRRAGYETVYGGKVHLYGMMGNIENCGFRKLTADERDVLADKCVEYLKGKHDKPFLLFASFINPHDICYQGLFAHGDMQQALDKAEGRTLREAEKMPDGVGREEFYAKYCPPLPANHVPAKDEPEAIRFARRQRPFKQYIHDKWTDEDWRLHRWAYARLTEVVDRQIGRVLGSLRENGLEDDTMVVITSDHGDMDSAHKLEHKSMTYDEAARIPLLVQWPGVTKAGYVDREHLVSNGLDLLPTLCDLAGVEAPKGLPGVSLRPLLGGRAEGLWRENLMVETEFGRGIVGGRYKYTLYDIAGVEETLFDMEDDAGEMKNRAGDKKYEDLLRAMRAALGDELRRANVKMDVPG
jgi:choline-sulfatase